MRVLITGATGFIGYNLYEYLKEETKWEIVGTYNSRKRQAMIKCDCMNYNDILKATKNIDIVFMFATKTFGAEVMKNNPELLVHENIIMNSNTLMACRENKVSRVIYLSSSTIYQESYNKLEESDLDLNKDPYDLYFGVAWVKRYTEKLCEFYSKLGVSCGILRLTYAYGEYDKLGHGSHFLPAIINRIINNKESIDVWGKGNALKNCLYVKDILPAIYNVALDNKKFDIYNICSDNIYSINEIIYLINNLLSINPKIYHDLTRPEAIPFRDLSRNKYDSTFGKLKQTPIEKGLKNTIKWIINLNKY